MTSLRSSRFIDFGTGTVKLAPMDMLKSMSVPWNDDQKIDLYECMTEVWQLGVAAAVLRQIEENQPPSVWSHAAYGLTVMTFNYFEMIGKTLNPNSQATATASADFNYGFCDVYPKFKPANGVFEDKLPPRTGRGSRTKQAPNPDIQTVVEFRDRIRNGLYHLGYTKHGVWIHNDVPQTADVEVRAEPDSANPGSTVQIYRMNPHQLTRTIIDHFPTFIARLRDPNPNGMRGRFFAFFSRLTGR